MLRQVLLVVLVVVVVEVVASMPPPTRSLASWAPPSVVVALLWYVWCLFGVFYVFLSKKRELTCRTFFRLACLNNDLLLINNKAPFLVGL
jgi:hypothetical protein